MRSKKGVLAEVRRKGREVAIVTAGAGRAKGRGLAKQDTFIYLMFYDTSTLGRGIYARKAIYLSF